MREYLLYINLAHNAKEGEDEPSEEEKEEELLSYSCSIKVHNVSLSSSIKEVEVYFFS